MLLKPQLLKLEVRLGHLRSCCSAFINATIKPSKQVANGSIDWFESGASLLMVQVTWPICRNGDCKNTFHGALEFHSAAESPDAFLETINRSPNEALNHAHTPHQVAWISNCVQACISEQHACVHALSHFRCSLMDPDPVVSCCLGTRRSAEICHTMQLPLARPETTCKHRRLFTATALALCKLRVPDIHATHQLWDSGNGSAHAAPAYEHTVFGSFWRAVWACKMAP